MKIAQGMALTMRNDPSIARELKAFFESERQMLELMAVDVKNISSSAIMEALRQSLAEGTVEPSEVLREVQNHI